MTLLRKFAHQYTINQPATFAEMIDGFGFVWGQTLRSDERIILGLSPDLPTLFLRTLDQDRLWTQCCSF